MTLEVFIFGYRESIVCELCLNFIIWAWVAGRGLNNTIEGDAVPEAPFRTISFIHRIYLPGNTRFVVTVYDFLFRLWFDHLTLYLQ